jgi:hypothetical protein
VECRSLTAAKEFEFSDPETARIRAALQACESFAASTDRRWLKPLVMCSRLPLHGLSNLRGSREDIPELSQTRTKRNSVTVNSRSPGTEWPRPIFPGQCSVTPSTTSDFIFPSIFRGP